MFNGTVAYTAKIRGGGLEFALFDYNPHVAGVDRVQLECPDGATIRAVVHLVGVATRNDGLALAGKVTNDGLARLSYHRGLAIEGRVLQNEQFDEVPQAGGGGAGVVAGAATLYVHASLHAAATIVANTAQLRDQLEQAAPPGERNFGLFRSALRSTSPVETYMSLYNLLLMLYNDRQADVDAFIVGQDAAVPQTQHPMKAAGVMETIYTRLRNEFAHQRPGVNVDDTKQGMAARLNALKELTRTAIRLHP